MSILYITQPDATINKAQEAFKVALKQEDGTWKKRSIPAQTVEQIVLMGNPQITGKALAYALDLGMPVHYLTYFGKYLGSALPGYSRNGQLRLAQFELYQDTKKRLELVKAIITAKIHNQRSILYRHGQKKDSLKLRKSQVNEQQTLDQISLRGDKITEKYSQQGIEETIIAQELKRKIKMIIIHSRRHRERGVSPV